MILSFLFSTVGRYVIGGLLIAAIAGGVILKIRRDAVLAERARIEETNREAIDKAREARDNARAACDSNPANCVPDDEYRD